MIFIPLGKFKNHTLHLGIQTLLADNWSTNEWVVQLQMTQCPVRVREIELRKGLIILVAKEGRGVR